MQSNPGNPTLVPTPLPHDVNDEDFQRWCTVVQIFKEFLECDAVIKFIEETCYSFFIEVVKDIKYSNQRYGGHANPLDGGSSTNYYHEYNYWKKYDERYSNSARLNLEATGLKYVQNGRTKNIDINSNYYKTIDDGQNCNSVK